MKSERGMVTLMTVFSGIAALMCLLVGIQLLVLESQIGQADFSELTEQGPQFRSWKRQAHTGAIMSLGAGVLITLFGLRNHTTTRRTLKNRKPDEDPTLATLDLDSVSVRVFDVDAQDRSIEITPPENESQLDESPPRSGVRPRAAAPHDEDEPDPEPPADPTDSILQSIHAASGAGSSRDADTSTTSIFLPAWLLRLFRPHRRS